MKLKTIKYEPETFDDTFTIGWMYAFEGSEGYDYGIETIVFIV